MDGESESANFGMVCPFLDDTPEYVLGYELGVLREEMRYADEINGYYHLEHQEQITLLISRLGWQIVEMRETDQTWFHLAAKRLADSP